MTTYGKGPKAEATRLHSKIVRLRGSCQSCGATENLQCAHIVSRRYANTRTDVDNAFCLCAGCHMRFTEWPLEFAEFVHMKIGETAYDRLREKAHRTTKVRWEDEVKRLKEMLAERLDTCS
jgi:hypothetical protein